MDLAANRMTGAMNKLLAVARRFDDAAGCAIGLGTRHRYAIADTALNQRDSRVACLRDDCEDLGIRLWHGLTYETHPGQIAVNCFAARLFCEQVDQHEVAGADWRIPPFTGTEMRIGRVRINCDDRRLGGIHAMRGDLIQHEALDTRLAAHLITAYLSRDFLECFKRNSA